MNGMLWDAGIMARINFLVNFLTLVSWVGVGVWIATSFYGELTESMNTVKKLEDGFNGVPQYVERVAYNDQRIEGIEQRIEGIEQRIEGIEQRIEGIEQKITTFTKRFWEEVGKGNISLAQATASKISKQDKQPYKDEPSKPGLHTAGMHEPN